MELARAWLLTFSGCYFIQINNAADVTSDAFSGNTESEVSNGSNQNFRLNDNRRNSCCQICFSVPNSSAVCGAVNVLFESNGQSLKLGEIKFGETCQVSLE